MVFSDFFVSFFVRNIYLKLRMFNTSRTYLGDSYDHIKL